MAGKEPFFISWEREISLDNLAPVSFFYGEQAAYLRILLSELKAKAGQSGISLQLKPYFLFEVDWPEILDEALSPDLFLFSARRLMVVYFPEYEDDDSQNADKAFKQFVSPYQKEIERYLSSPPAGVSLLIVFSGKLRKGNKLLNFFFRLKEAFPQSLALLEMKTPRETEIMAWIHQELGKRGKKTSPQVSSKLLEVVGPDLVSLSQELEKLSLFSGENKMITEEDIFSVCAWQKTYDRFAIEEALESGSLEDALSITRRFLAEQPEASEIINYFASLSRYLLSLVQAKVEVERLKVPVKEVFKKLHPQINEGWSLFDRKLQAFSACLGSFSQEELDDLIRELSRVDLKLKSSDLEPGMMIETFLVRFFQLRDRKKKI